MKPQFVTILIKAASSTVYYVILFNMLYNVVLTFVSVNETLVVFDHSNGCCWVVIHLLSCCDLFK